MSTNKLSCAQTTGLNESINNPPYKNYKRVEEKPYHKWLNDHRDEILNQPAKTRAQYAFEKLMQI